MATAKQGKGPRRFPIFDPARWVPDATRQVDITGSLPALLDALARDDETSQVPRDAWLRERYRRIATVLQTTAPLYELSAALIAPYLRSTASYWGLLVADGSDPRPLEDHLIALMAQRHALLAPDDYDEWLGLADRLWTTHVAWAGTELRHQPTGADSLQRLDDDAYRRLLAEYFLGTDRAMLLARSAQLVVSFAQEFAQLIIELLDPAAAARDRAEILLGLRQIADPVALLPPAPTAGPPAQPPDLQDGHLPVLNSAHYHALREALYLRRFERVGDSRWPTAMLAGGSVRAMAQLRPPEASEIVALPDEVIEELMWRQRQELSDLDADVMDYLSAAYLATAATNRTHADARVDDILRMRGIQPRHRGQGRRSGFTAEQRREILGSLTHITNIELTVAANASEGGDLGDDAGEGSDDTIPVVRSRAFVITSHLGQMDTRTGAMTDMNRFTFRPGAVLEHFLLGPGHQTALLSAMALRYDPYRQRWEKRLARYLSWQWRIQARRGSYGRPYRVATLLERVGETINARHPSRTRDRLEGALDTLQQDGVIGSWAYANWNEEQMGQAGWYREWEEATVQLEPPETIRRHYRSISRQPALELALGETAGDARQLRLLPEQESQPTPAGTIEGLSPDDLAVELKARRADWGLSQVKVAKDLAISQGHYSKLERAHPEARVRAPELDAALIVWFRNHPPKPSHA